MDLGEAAIALNIGLSEKEGTKGGSFFDSRNRKTRDAIVIAIRTKRWRLGEAIFATAKTLLSSRFHAS
jgi:hypothetical protein